MTEELSTAAANRGAANDMGRCKSASTQRLHASYVVEAELQHLEWATKQPSLNMLDTDYWRRRVLAIKGRFELTAQQGARLERILERLSLQSD